VNGEGGTDIDWGPTASVPALQARAELLSAIRRFFENRGVLEVETPVLGAAGAPDPHLDNIAVHLGLGPGAAKCRLFLQTSPEHAMKRLLAADSGPIFQMCKAFRGEECGRLHNPEFTLLEWYRPGMGANELMNEVDELLAEVAGLAPARRLHYREAFSRHVAIDPFAASIEALRAKAAEAGLDETRRRCLPAMPVWIIC